MYPTLFALLALTLSGGLCASQFVAPNLGWYAGLSKPPFSPPDWLFAPVWSALYILMAVAAWRIWRITGLQSRPMGLWFLQLLLNFLWPWFFFEEGAIGVALLELLLLWGGVLGLIYLFYRIDRRSGWLLVPYFAWVSFAAALNFGIWWQN
jgi:translocator protein